MLVRATIVFAAVLGIGATFTSTAVGTPSVVDQYTEQLPTPEGEIPSSGDGKNGSGNRFSPLSSSGSGSSSSGASGSGSDVPASGGRTTVRSEASKASRRKADGIKTEKSAKRNSGKRRQSEPDADVDPNASLQERQSAGVGSGMGLGFPILLLLAASVIAAVAIARERSENGRRSG